MRTSASSGRYQASTEQIWELITNPHDFTWRSHVRTASVYGDFYSETSSQTGYPSEYTIIHDEENVRRDVTVRHVDGNGARSFVLTGNPDGSTILEIVEQFEFNGPKLLQPLVNRFMKSQRRAYLKDLRKVLS